MSDQTFSTIHHTFDIYVAAVYGVNEAIIINYFQYWIDFNMRTGKNFKEGRFWTYDPIKTIAAHFPYFTENDVREIIERLCTGKSRRGKGEPEFEPVLMKGNFNKLAMDKTTWYSFVNQKMFTKGHLPTSKGHLPKAIPHTITTHALACDNNDKACSPLSTVSIQKTLSSKKNNIEKKEVVKTYKLNAEQRVAFDWLKTQNIDSDEQTLSYWAKTYDFDRLKNVVAWAKREERQSIGAYIQNLLKKNAIVETPKQKENKQLAVDYKREHQWHDLTIHERFMSCKNDRGHDREAFFDVAPETFFKKLLEIHNWYLGN